jgi:lipid-binding SYLF domain-containing protein
MSVTIICNNKSIEVKEMKLKSVFLSTVLMLSGMSVAWADATPAECQESVANFKSLASNVGSVIASAYGYAVFPTIGKGGFGIGGAGGSGCVYAGGGQTGTSKMGQVTIGFQAGGQAFSQIILFQDKETFDKFITGEFEFGAQASAVALTAAAQAEAGTKGSTASVGTSDEKSGGKASSYTNGMAVFTVAKGGLMYEASIGGQKFGYEAL